tara:strand:- start:462 stop:2291 length:1830 start_codon:yes stop_codon:yes gene_type:complete
MDNNLVYICDVNFQGDTKSINLADRNFFVSKDQNKYRLFEALCPHMGGTIHKEKENFKCGTHNWTFNLRNGHCNTSPKLKLPEFKTTIKDGKIYAKITVKKTKTPTIKKCYKKDLRIKLHSHACLEIIYKKFKILTDPWFNGPAFLGAWTNYPANKVDSTKIKPDIIWISHEHSDHFHPETLKLFDKNIPIYFPDFPNQRIFKQLKKLNFKNLFPMPFGKKIKITSNVSITCFQPNSPWNDSMLLLQVDDFKFLNLNDAGVNHKIKNIIGDVDLISTAFTTGASGFPLTWNLTDEEKLSWIKNDQNGQTEMLLNAIKTYNCKFILPFAGHFQLWHPDHKKHVPLIGTIKISDVEKILEDKPVKLINLLPGDEFYFKELKTTRKLRRANHKDLYSLTNIQKYLEQTFDQKTFDKFYPRKKIIKKQKIIDYFLKFNSSPEIIFCEDLFLEIESQGFCDLYFKINNGKIQHLKSKPNIINLKIKIPIEVLQEVVSLDLSWDEAQIGYWCETQRLPKNKYNINFWRMVQAPYYKRNTKISKHKNFKKITKSTAILKIIFGKNEDLARKILNRYGLYCHSCVFSQMEDIHSASLKHGLSDDQSNNLIRELNEII